MRKLLLWAWLLLMVMHGVSAQSKADDKSEHIDIEKLNYNKDLSEDQIFKFCGLVRYYEQGIHIKNGFNFWRYEELALEIMNVDVSHPQASEVIRLFFQANYDQIYCKKYQHWPDGGLLQQFICNREENMLCDFLEITDIDPLTIKDQQGTRLITWLRKEINDLYLTPPFKNFYKSVLEDLENESLCEDDWFDG